MSATISGARTFNSIVAMVRSRTGLDYSKAFNRVLADNADLMRTDLTGSDLTAPFLRLLNRTATATGLGEMASVELASGKIKKLANRFFPSIANAPIALQWDLLWRAAEQLEKCGVAQKLFNRAARSDVSKTDWKAANVIAPDALLFLEDDVAKVESGDVGHRKPFQQMYPARKWGCFRNAIDGLMNDEGLSVSDAFSRLKETQPVFWAYSILSFESKDNYPHAL